MFLGLGLAINRRGFGGTALPLVQFSATSFPEDTAVDSVVATLSVANLPDGITVSSYAITADPEARFAIDGSNLELAAPVNYETATTHSVTVEATLSDLSTVERTQIFTVTDVAEGDFVPSLNFSDLRNSGYAALLADF